MRELHEIPDAEVMEAAKDREVTVTMTVDQWAFVSATLRYVEDVVPLQNRPLLHAVSRQIAVANEAVVKATITELMQRD